MAVDGARLAAAQHCVRRASMWLRGAQDRDGAWRVAPEARAIENGLALLLCPEAFRTADAARMRVSLTVRQGRSDGQAAYEAESFVVERVHRGTCEPAPTLDLSLPGWRSDGCERHSTYFAALGYGLQWTMRGAPPCDVVRGRVGDALAGASDGQAGVVWASLAVLNGARDARSTQALATGQRRDGSFGAHPLVTCLAVAALARLPRSFEGARAHALRWLDACGRNDVGLRVAHADVGDTVLAARALDEALPWGPPHVGARPYLRAARNGDGGLPQRAGERSDVDATALAVPVFDGSPVAAALIARLRTMQRDDGLWHRGLDGAPALDRTALALASLARSEAPVTARERVADDDARRWIARTWADPAALRTLRYASEPWMVLTLVDALGPAHDAAREAVAWLLARQRGDGSFAPSSTHRGSAAATGAALAALAGTVRSDDPRALAAVDWLVGNVSYEGRFTGPCDAYSPRPFLVDHPVRAHALALFGLARWLRGCDGITATARGPLRIVPRC